MLRWITNNLLYIVVGVGLIMTTLWLFAFRENLRMKGYVAIFLAILGFVVGYALVRVFAFLEGAPGKGAMSLFGAELFLPIFFLIGAKLTKRSPRTVCDLYTPCLLATMILARIQCLIKGCCKGKIIPLFGNEQLCWPTREMEMVFYVVFLLLFVPRIWKYYKGEAIYSDNQKSGDAKRQTWFQKKIGKNSFLPGTAYPIYMVAYGIFRFFVEFLRDKGTDKLFHLSHLWALISLGVGALFWYELKAEERIKAKKKKR